MQRRSLNRKCETSVVWQDLNSFVIGSMSWTICELIRVIYALPANNSMGLENIAFLIKNLEVCANNSNSFIWRLQTEMAHGCICIVTNPTTEPLIFT